MKDVLKITLYGAPRILGVLFIYLISKPALAVLTEYPSWDVFMGLFAELRWGILLAVVLVFAWRWEWIGTLGFGAYAFWYLAFVHGYDANTFLAMAGLPIMTALLFFIGFTFKKDILE